MLLSSTALAQTPQELVTAAPQGPTALLLQAAKVNGLNGDDLKPWQLKVSYKLLDFSGQPTDQGTIEEFWAGPKLGKLVITSATSKLVYLQTEKAAYREGELDQKTSLLKLLASAFVDPMPFSDKSLAHLDLTLQTRAMGSLQLRCFSLGVHGGAPGTFNSSTYSDPAYCLENNLPIIQIGSFADDSHRFISFHTGKFQGRYVPVDITAEETNKPDLTAHLDLLEQVSNIDPAVFKHSPTCTGNDSRDSRGNARKHDRNAPRACNQPTATPVSRLGTGRKRSWHCHDACHNRYRWAHCCSARHQRT